MKKVELPLCEPIYSTYHYQGSDSAVLLNNPSMRNWYLNQVMILKCNRKFLKGFTTPEIDVLQSAWYGNPNFKQWWYPMRHAKGYIHLIIRELLDNGYYVCFGEIDDYYVKGKSWYKERHHSHDGLICGYNQEDKTYCIYAYDSNWVYQKFWTPQKGFEAGRLSMFKKGIYGTICGVKPRDEQMEFSPGTVVKNLKEYLDSSMKKYPVSGEGDVFGIAVHDYIAMYVDKLYDGSIPYERLDRRVFRQIWEHKNAMLERIETMEKVLELDTRSSTAYKQVVAQADKIRILYAAHHMRRRDSVLPIIREKLLALKTREREILRRFIKKAEGAMQE